MVASTKPRVKSPRKVASRPRSAPMPVPVISPPAACSRLRNRVQYVEAFLGRRLDADSFQARQDAIAAGSLPSVAAYPASYLVQSFGSRARLSRASTSAQSVCHSFHCGSGSLARAAVSLQRWVLQWRDLVKFGIVPVSPSEVVRELFPRDGDDRD